MQILVEHSGYELLNTGDSAMLQAALLRLAHRWPEAEITVISSAPGRASLLSPSVLALGAGLADRPGYRRLPRRVRLGGEQAYKTVSPLFPIRSKSAQLSPPTSIRDAIRRSDLVIAAGGGYVCDPFWWHGAGVMSTLRAAQRMGRPTAMFGQGLGPLTHPLLKTLLRSVAPRLELLTLREGIAGLAVLSRLGLVDRFDGDNGDEFQLCGGTRVCITGDDALKIAIDLPERTLESKPDRPLIGVNLRISGYAGLGGGVSDSFAVTMRDVAAELDCDLRALPVSHYKLDNDLDAVERSFADVATHTTRTGPRLITDDLTSPAQLAAAAGACAVVVTGSYHGAVFALAAGVPTVAMTASPYYDGKFEGLAGLYPGLVQIVGLNQPNLPDQLHSAVRAAAALPEEMRRRGRQRSRELASRADDAFEWWAERVESRAGHSAIGRGKRVSIRSR